MTSDTGFAPNPYHGTLTLATCKPAIRRCSQVGDWIGGWTGVKVVNKDGNIIHFSNNQRLVYLARVSEVIKIQDYWSRFPEKRPFETIFSNLSEEIYSCGDTSKTVDIQNNGCGSVYTDKSITTLKDCGDNIYELNDGEWIYHNNPNHDQSFQKHDLSGKNVLLCEGFYYYGVDDEKALDVSHIFGIHIPRGNRTLVMRMLNGS